LFIVRYALNGRSPGAVGKIEVLGGGAIEAAATKEG
jgi:hypothetical protein